MKKTSSNHQNETNNSIKRSNINFYNFFNEKWEYKINMIKGYPIYLNFRYLPFSFYLKKIIEKIIFKIL